MFNRKEPGAAKAATKIEKTFHHEVREGHEDRIMERAS
jgi:hypothetical protein